MPISLLGVFLSVTEKTENGGQLVSGQAREILKEDAESVVRWSGKRNASCERNQLSMMRRPSIWYRPLSNRATASA